MQRSATSQEMPTGWHTCSSDFQRTNEKYSDLHLHRHGAQLQPLPGGLPSAWLPNLLPSLAWGMRLSQVNCVPDHACVPVAGPRRRGLARGPSTTAEKKENHFSQLQNHVCVPRNQRIFLERSFLDKGVRATGFEALFEAPDAPFCGRDLWAVARRAPMLHMHDSSTAIPIFYQNRTPSGLDFFLRWMDHHTAVHHLPAGASGCLPYVGALASLTTSARILGRNEYHRRLSILFLKP